MKTSRYGPGRPFVLAVGLAAILVGCAGHGRGGAGSPGGSGSPTPGVVSSVPIGSPGQSIQSGGRTRTYRLYRPASLKPSSPAPLVVFLHGGFGDGEQAEQSYGWDAEADAAGFVVVYPDGVSKAWNGGTCCGLPASQDVDDVGFIRGSPTTSTAGTVTTALAACPDGRVVELITIAGAGHQCPAASQALRSLPPCSDSTSPQPRWTQPR